MDKQEKEFLAMEYILGELDDQSKMKFFDLLINDKEFKTIFKQQLEIDKIIKNTEYEISPCQKNKIYDNILNLTQQSNDNETKDLCNKIIYKILPSVFSINKYIKEMCLDGWVS